MTTTTWLGLTSSAWQNDMNWSASQPGAGSDILIAVQSGAETPPFTPVLANAAVNQGTLDLEGGYVTFDNVTLGGASGGLLVNVTGNPSASGAGSDIVAQHTVTLDTNATVDIAPVASGVGGLLDLVGTEGSATVENDGVINNGNIFENDCTLINNGTIAGGTVQAFGTVTGDGTIEGGAPEFFNTVASGQTIVAGGVISLLEFDTAAEGTGTFGGQIVDMASGDQIFLAAVGGVSVASYAAGVLNLTSSEGAISLDATGPGITSFTASSSDSGTLLTAACYAAGTSILTEHGERPIETLREGDRVVTASGATPELQPMRWIGRVRIDLARHPDPAKVAPIRIRADAFAPGMPVRDLLVSPDHAVLVGDILVPAYRLCNGATILREPARGTVTYFHVECDRHTLLLAEGLPAESYLDTGNRAAFDNAGVARMLHPDFTPGRWARDACRNLVLEGAVLATAHRRLRHRATALGWRHSRDPGLALLADGRPVPLQIAGLVARARVPGGTAELRLLSRSWTPCERDHRETDTRTLGVAVSRLWLDGRAASLESPALTNGWHPPEPGWRWTDGNARLVPGAATEIAFGILRDGTYWREHRPGLDARAA